ncbi:hypothetical protein AMATHDRAFT_147710 [Amanita thiersii Skay4041]|uniref:Uncharacterized protein n=1 Tax=Amanita thiersii Skay4041 TaxID=703135 RepID=A0A2A9NEH3_9AGAR|nr:hypothetical protein AMATHDRAFT_147710 [Amanita thiersii Skay4041]
MAKKGFFSFLYDHFTALPPLATKDLAGKTVVVIGANTGLGFEASKHFARMNPERLILGCRNQSKGERAIARIKMETGYERAELWLIDLLQFSSVQEFADKYEKEGGRLDYLILNAGIIPATQRQETEDGWESCLQVNCLSPSLLALRLLPRMIQTASEHSTAPRLVLVSSLVHYWVSLEDKILNSDKPLHILNDKEYCTKNTMKLRYHHSKLINILFIRALNAHLKNQSITVNTVNPGYCHSDLQRNYTGLSGIFADLSQRIFAISTEEGSRQLVWAALGECDQELGGAYISRSEVTEPSDFVISEEGKEVQEKLWVETLGILGKVDSKVETCIEQYLDH